MGLILYFNVAAVLVILDQVVKYWAATHLALGQSAPLLPGFVELLRVHNDGAAWSSFSGMRWLLVAVTAAVMVFVASLIVRRIVRHPAGVFACTLILAGGAGNLIDRIRLGYVVDLFHFQFMEFPVFNVADICVSCGAVLGLIYYLWFYDRDRARR